MLVQQVVALDLRLKNKEIDLAVLKKSKKLPSNTLTAITELFVAFINGVSSECEKQEILLEFPDPESKLQCVRRFADYMESAIKDREAATKIRVLVKAFVEVFQDREGKDRKEYRQDVGQAMKRLAGAFYDASDTIEKGTWKVQSLHKKREKDQKEKLNPPPPKSTPKKSPQASDNSSQASDVEDVVEAEVEPE